MRGGGGTLHNAVDRGGRRHDEDDVDGVEGESGCFPGAILEVVVEYLVFDDHFLLAQEKATILSFQCCRCKFANRVRF